MPRQKYQRPEVYATGKREKLWKAEWREYFIGTDGKEHSRHKSKTWSQRKFTKTQAQEEFDKFLAEQRQGGTKRDGSMTLADFWEQVYYPVRSRKWEFNTRRAILSAWNLHIKPRFGAVELKDISKSDVELHLGKLADAGKGKSLVDAVFVRLHSMLEEAVDNDYIPKNPCRKIEVPPCKKSIDPRSLTVDEVRRLWDATMGKEYLLWRVLIMTGARIGEALALERADITAEGIRIDQGSVNGRPTQTKNKKTRLAPIPASLREELERWLRRSPHSLLFCTCNGKMYRRGGRTIQGLLDRARNRAKIPDLTFRMCRTTFSTLFDGDIRDAQEILGHHAVDFTLAVYRKPVVDRQLAAIEALDLKLVRIDQRKKGAA